MFLSPSKVIQNGLCYKFSTRLKQIFHLLHQLRINNLTHTHTHAHLLVLPYKEIQGEHTLKHIKREINKLLPEDKNMLLVYTGTKLGSKVNVKDKTKKKHHHDSTYSVKCPMKNCLESYNGETGRRLIERVNEHSGKDMNSHMFKHSMAANYPTVTIISLFLEVATATGRLRGRYQNLYSSNRPDLR